MATNLVLVPVDGQPELGLELSAAGGGHLVVDLVGWFEPSGPTAAGRLVPVAPHVISALTTATDGREATVAAPDDPALPARGLGALLLRVVADVGDNGGRVRLGPAAGERTSSMMWAPPSGPDRIRSGLAIVPLDDTGAFAYDYEGGSRIEVEVLGYMTDESAEISTAGLFVPHDPVAVVAGPVVAGTSAAAPVAALLDASPAAIGQVLLTLTGTAESQGAITAAAPGADPPTVAVLGIGGGRPRNGAGPVPVDARGIVSLSSDVDVTLVAVATGYFTAG
jgi:hypothetical protein